MIKKWFMVVVVLSTLLGACTQAQAPSEAPTLKIGLLPVLEALPMYVAESQGYFKNEGISIEFVPAASAAERDQLMQAGQIDGMINDLVSTVLYNKETQKIAVVRFARTATPDNAQYSILAAKESGISGLAGLQGVEIGISEGTVIAYVTDRLLQLEGFSPADIKTTNVIKIADRLQLLGQGQLKAATLPDPYSSLAIQGGATVIVDDRKHTELGNSVISFRAETLKAKPNTVKKFLAALEKAVNDVNATPEKWDAVLTEKKLIPAPLTGKYTLPKFPAASVPSEAQFKDVQDWMKGKGLISAEVAYTKLADASYLPK
ncbi:MAG: MetQ/NlpA family ABC transporter substrate-binding protein [Chloroflexi bacterium]|nr:MetQ/NlpA family ABC transporter substrate-binding protein [Chloroflexota bacterium]